MSETSQPLFDALSRWSDHGPLSNHTNVRLIRHQPTRASLAYLHETYPGLSAEEISQIAQIVGNPIPSRLRTLFGDMNGMRLFEAKVSISGLVTRFTRDPSVRNPISIAQDNRTFRYIHPHWHAEGFFQIGGVSFVRQDKLICGPNDRVILLHAKTGDPLCEFVDVFECLMSFVREMGPFWTDEGHFTGDWNTLDKLLLAPSASA
jgi:hypothetical protein